jgi:DnaJ-domain-containing protein 1
MLYRLSNIEDSSNDSSFNDNAGWNAYQLRLAELQRTAEEDELSRAIAVAAELEALRRQVSGQAKHTGTSSSSSASQTQPNSQRLSSGVDFSKPSVQAAYKELELPLGAAMEDVKTAYRNLMMRYHPDRTGQNFPDNRFSDNQPDAERAQRVNRAYNLLRQEWGV